MHVQGENPNVVAFPRLAGWLAGELAAAAAAAAAPGIDARRSEPIPMWHPSIQSCPVPSHPIPRGWPATVTSGSVGTHTYRWACTLSSISWLVKPCMYVGCRYCTRGAGYAEVFKDPSDDRPHHP